MRSTTLWFFISALAAQASGHRFLLSFEPVKMVPLIDGVPAYHYKYAFNGLQAMGYCGFQHIGKYAFASISVGAGFNIGAHRENKIIDPDHELPPKILSQPPIALLTPFTPVDLEISLGAVF